MVSQHPAISRWTVFFFGSVDALAVSTRAPQHPSPGGTLPWHADTFIKQVDEHWTFIAKPEHMRGILQNDRHCQPTHRNLPKGRPAPPRRQPEGEKKVTGLLTSYFSIPSRRIDQALREFLRTIPETRKTRTSRNPTDVLLRFALAEDENGEAWVIPDSNALYPGRGMRVLPSWQHWKCVRNLSFTNSFKRPHVRLPLGIEGLFVLFLKISIASYDDTCSLNFFPFRDADYVEAQLKRHTQLALAQALSVASSVKRIEE